MKDLAFRFWDTTDKRFIDDGLISKSGHVCYCKGHGIEWCDDVIPSQYTGCHDADGKPIYEGDILLCGKVEGTVMFFVGNFVVDWGDQTDSNLNELMVADMKVIGNIYESK